MTTTPHDELDQAEECELCNTPTTVFPLAGPVRDARAQRMQGGLPSVTQALWRWLVARFGATIKLLGAWGDTSHQARKSDHNLGFAIDASPFTRAQGDAIAAALIANRKALGLSYVIWYERIASAKSGWKWRPYTGASKHRDHVHASLVHN